jgi:hypothetical protein
MISEDGVFGARSAKKVFKMKNFLENDDEFSDAISLSDCESNI